MKKISIFLLMLLGIAAYSQDLTVKAAVMNPSKNINDGVVDLQVLGGTLPTALNGAIKIRPLLRTRQPV